MADDHLQRRKSEKFGILDSPALRKTDLQSPRGPRGRAILYIDIDHFKVLNTKYKETLIDQTLLPAFQTLLSEIVEPHGRIYAEGGDEVVVLLNNCSAFLACAVAEDIRATVEGFDFFVGADKIRITISVGVAHSQDHDTGADLQMKANEAKDQSKNRGRNRTSIARRDLVEAIQLPRTFLEQPASPVISPAGLLELAEEEETIISEYGARPSPFYSSFYCAGSWKTNPFMANLPETLREQVVSRISMCSLNQIPRVRRSLILVKALDNRGQPCILTYHSGRPTDGWMTWLLPNVDRDAPFRGQNFLEYMAEDLRTFLSLTAEEIVIHDLQALSVCVKTNRHGPQPDMQTEPKFFALRYYYATISSLPEQMLRRSFAVPQGSIDRRLRWFYSEELPSVDNRRIWESNADVIKTIYDICTTLLTNVPEAVVGSRLSS